MWMGNNMALPTKNLNTIIHTDIGSLTWVNVPAYSAKWTSDCQVAFTNGGNTAYMRGDFTSTEDNNDDPCGTFPAGFTGLFTLAVSHVINGQPTVAIVGSTPSQDLFGSVEILNTGDKVRCFFEYTIESP